MQAEVTNELDNRLNSALETGLAQWVLDSSNEHENNKGLCLAIGRAYEKGFVVEVVYDRRVAEEALPPYIKSFCFESSDPDTTIISTRPVNRRHSLSFVNSAKLVLNSRGELIVKTRKFEVSPQGLVTYLEGQGVTLNPEAIYTIQARRPDKEEQILGSSEVSDEYDKDDEAKIQEERKALVQRFGGVC
jgi:hypothetical protein